jgi:two-component system chemotaxis sensor kinase CheA
MNRDNLLKYLNSLLARLIASGTDAATLAEVSRSCIDLCGQGVFPEEACGLIRDVDGALRKNKRPVSQNKVNEMSSALCSAIESAIEAMDELAAQPAVPAPVDDTAAVNTDTADIPSAQEPQGSAPAPTARSGSGDTAAPPIPPDIPDSMPLPPDADRELVAEFLTESREYVEKSEASLLVLETDPADHEAINTVFRAFHTIKGTSSFIGLPIVSEFCHKTENLLSRVRDGEIPYTPACANIALRAVDILKDLLRSVTDALGGQDITKPAGYDEIMAVLLRPDLREVISAADNGIGDGGTPRLGDLLVAAGKAAREDVEAVATDQGKEPLGVALVRSGVASVSDVGQALRVQQKLQGAPASEQRAENTVRVRTERLDRLIDTVGELVIAQSMLEQDAVISRTDHLDLQRKTSHLGKIVRELQDLSMSMRMVPLRATFQKMNRLVRDLAQKSGKQVLFTAEGDDTEIDRNMVDYLNDPLVHMIRNAVDHGLETAEERRRAGKPEAGAIKLKAYHAGGNVVVEVCDDGRGLNRERILRKGIEKGLLEAGREYSDNEVYGLIFKPGFSTAEQVTDISGRGVGMDVVRSSIEKLRGRIETHSDPGKGCRFIIRMPLTMAITDGMLVKVGRERYIVPITNIRMSLRPAPQQISTIAGRAEMLQFRDRLMPLYRLHRLFAIPDAVEDPTQGLVVIVEDGASVVALLVDELLGQQQVVAKAMHTGTGKTPGVSGGAILGDGRVGVILDIPGIIAIARGDAHT